MVLDEPENFLNQTFFLAFGNQTYRYLLIDKLIIFSTN